MKPNRKAIVKKKAVEIEKQLKKLEATVLSGGKSGYDWKKSMSGKEIVAMLKRNGWEEVSQNGSHNKLKKNGIHVIVPMHKEIRIGTLSSIKATVNSVEKI